MQDAEARRLFDQARRRAHWRQLWSAVRGIPATLAERDDLLEGATPVGQRVSGVQQVVLEQIIGSEGRAHEFDRGFGPLQEHTRTRWQSVAAAWLAGATLPPVRLIQAGDRYLVRDGHHRISVARAFGASSIDAVIEQRFAAPLAGDGSVACQGLFAILERAFPATGPRIRAEQPADHAAVAVIHVRTFSHQASRALIAAAPMFLPSGR